MQPSRVAHTCAPRRPSDRLRPGSSRDLLIQTARTVHATAAVVLSTRDELAALMRSLDELLIQAVRIGVARGAVQAARARAPKRSTQGKR